MHYITTTLKTIDLLLLTLYGLMRLGIFSNEYTLWPRTRYLWGARMLINHAIYRDWYSTKTDDGFWAVPRITLRFIK